MTNATVKTSAAARSSQVRKLAVAALLSAMATVLMFISFGLPFLPSYLKVDFSELPALLASFALGPVYGVAVCLIKNLFNLPATTTGGVGELCNFLLVALLVLPAGILYRRKPSRKTAVISMVVGTLVMTVCSFFVNVYLVYPAYLLVMPEQAIVDMYTILAPWADEIWKGILTFNVPLTLGKGILDSVLTFLLYKHLSPILKGKV